MAPASRHPVRFSAYLFLALFFLTLFPPVSSAEDAYTAPQAAAEEARLRKQKEIEERFSFLSRRLNNLPRPPEVKGKAISLPGVPPVPRQISSGENADQA